MKKKTAEIAAYIFGFLILALMITLAVVVGNQEQKQDLWIQGHCKEIDRRYYGNGGDYVSKKLCDNGEIKWVR